jgi:hypothetical protein
MQFDPGQVIAFADEYRLAKSGNDKPGSKDLADRLAVAGWRVERVPARHRSLPLFLILPAIAWFWYGSGRVVPDGSVLVRLGILGLVMASFGAALFLSFRRMSSGVPEEDSQHLLATDRSHEDRPARVVLFTRLGSPGLAWPDGSRALLLVCLALGIALLLPGTTAHPWVTWGLLAGQWLALMLVLGRLFPSAGVDSSGMAMLAELVRTWPKGARDRVETWVIVTPDVSDLGRELGDRFGDGKPTLALALDTPGAGTLLTIAGRGPAG